MTGPAEASAPDDGTDGGMSVDCASLSANGRKARYGLAYMRSVCSQAGVGMMESSPDEDVLAVDCSVALPPADVRVQVKCTSKWNLSGHTLSFPIEEAWVRKWDQNLMPTYFVVVIVPNTSGENWVSYEAEGAFHHAAAFWARIPRGVSGSLSIPKSQALVPKTMDIWNQQVLFEFGAGDLNA